MPAHKKPFPAYRLHKQSGQAIVTVNIQGTRKDMVLGVYNSAESRAEYQRVLHDLEAGRLNPGIPTDITVNELCARYWKFAEVYYPPVDGKMASELSDFKYAIREFRGYAGDMLAREFGPLAFKALRERMIAKGWCRPVVNRQCGRVKRIVRWAVENELLPADRWEALRSVPGLKAGRTTASEPEPIGPVDEAHYRAALPFVTEPVRGLLELLELTGMRPGEACRIRPCDIDTTAVVWVYRPEKHKTKYRGKGRAVPLGSKARALLMRFQPGTAMEHYFRPGTDNGGKPRSYYDAHSLAVAVERACIKAKVAHWHPNQLRHLFATTVRRLHGLEAAQVLLGHAKANITEVYAEKNLALAAKIG